MLLVVFVLAGCSDDDGEEGLTKAEYIAQADAICVKHNETQTKLTADIPSTATAAETAKVYLDKVIPDTRAQQEELRALAAPDADRDLLEDFYDDVDEVIGDIEKGLRDHPEETLSAEVSPFADLNARGKEYGFKDCSEG